MLLLKGLDHCFSWTLLYPTAVISVLITISVAVTNDRMMGMMVVAGYSTSYGSVMWL